MPGSSTRPSPFSAGCIAAATTAASSSSTCATARGWSRSCAIRTALRSSRKPRRSATSTASAVEGRVRRRPEGTVNRQPRLRRSRSAVHRARDPQPVRVAAVPARRRGPVGSHAPHAPRVRPAPAADAEEPDAALPRDHGGAQVPRRQGLHRHRDADAHQEHARGRARLPRALARASGPVLRAAAVAAAVQAAADGRGLRPLLPDHQVLPRRGPARRPPARVHADRLRDLVPRRAGDPRDLRGHGAPGVPRSAQGRAAGVPGHDPRRRRCACTARTSRTCA